MFFYSFSNYGGGHKSGASMSALTLLAFLFFLHILQQCIKDHMTEMSTPPVMIMTAGREGDDTQAITKSAAFNKIDKTGMTETSETHRMDTRKQNKVNEKNSEKNPYNNSGSSNKQQLTKVKTADDTKSEDTKNKYVFKSYPNRTSYFAGLYSAMDEE
ncbi:hypothetical protein B5X24_HaOG206439 [Helicoverpa armigera]|uniref:Uncharacterized protein n=1 Tax=Helicoverpa armigera TaxID=29058 RepID=A0A2W1BNY2_HELAM|nr:hypothetical protein B5X24_HaOG206439 [Helicoverpa armigera]